MAHPRLLPRRKRIGDTECRRNYEDVYPAFVREVDNLLGRFFSSFDNESLVALQTMEGDFMPSVDVKETKKEIKVTTELPGMDEDGIDITLSEDTLTIRGGKKEEAEDTGSDYYQVGRRFGSFYRTIFLGAEAEQENSDQEHLGV